LGHQIEKGEIGWACSTYEGEERCVQDFGGKTGWKKDHLEDLGYRWKDKIKRVFKKYVEESVHCVYMSQGEKN